MSDKSTYEVAGDITVAWLAAMGSLAANPSFVSDILKIISDPQKVADFYKTIETAINS